MTSVPTAPHHGRWNLDPIAEAAFYKPRRGHWRPPSAKDCGLGNRGRPDARPGTLFWTRLPRVRMVIMA